MLNINSILDFQKGQILGFNKPIGWTSFDLVKKVKKLIVKYSGEKRIKVGHAGTLDPLADGLLIICTGKSTKTISELQLLDKQYIATIKFGETTPSFDLETQVDKKYKTEHISIESFNQVIKSFIGIISQVPPAFSAKKYKGSRAYDLARQGKFVELDPVQVEIKSIETIEFKIPVVKLKIVCSKGTYIRALARDIGYALKSGAHLIDLKRNAIGNYNLNSAITIEQFEKKLTKL